MRPRAHLPMASLDGLAHDLRFAQRSLRRTPVIVAAAVLSIALGITATTAVFSIVDAALFRPPPLERPDRLAAVYIVRQSTGGTIDRQRWSWPRFRLLQRHPGPFQNVASFSRSVLAITGESAEPVNAEVVSSSYFATLRVRPVAGRIFDPADDEPATAHAVALIGWDLWQRRLGGERSALGGAIRVNGVPLTIIGVLPQGFEGLTGRAQLWIPPTVPSQVSYAEYQTTNQNFISVIGRLRDGVTVERARNDMAAIGASIDGSLPSGSEASGDTYSATAISLAEARIDPSTRLPLLLLLAAAACLLALACANVAGLLLGRAVSRRREIAIRVATGASRWRVMRQLMVEAALLAGAGGALGVAAAMPLSARLGLPAAAWRGRNFYGALGEFATPRVDVRVIVFAVALCALTTLLFGLMPALRATRVDLTHALKDGSAGGGRGTGGRIDARRLIVGIETGLAIILLVSGGLLAAAWARLGRTDTGFDRTHLLTFQILPSEARYPAPKAPALIARVLAAIAVLPGVESASVDGCAPVGPGCANSTLYVIGREQPRPEAAPPVLRHYVAPDHFRTLRVPLLRGRVFDDRDRAGAKHVAIINQLAARRFWPDDDPIGKRVWFGGGSTFDRPDSAAEIVGIVGDVAYQTFDEHPFQPDFYTPYAQFSYAFRIVLVRTRGDPLAVVPDIRRALGGVDATLAMYEVRTMDTVIADSFSRLSYQTRLLLAFAAAALAIAAVGIFAIIAHALSDRRREIGIRAALGATPLRLLAAVGTHGARPAAIGLITGLIVAIGVGRILSAVVFGVRAVDPMVFAPVAVLVTIVVVLSTALAARRALTIDPAESLKTE